jgi:HD superfamily phosphohydrolase
MLDLPLTLAKNQEIVGTLDSYLILEPIRPGASGVVYKAIRKSDRLEVAVKFYLPIAINVNDLFRAGGKDKLERLKRWHEQELKCLRKLDHPGIVTVLDDGEFTPLATQLGVDFEGQKSIKFLVTKFIAGKEFGDLLTKSQLTAGQIARLLGGICDVLIYLHEEREYLHGDIRPENIIVEKRTGRPVIIDFALFKNFNFTEVQGRERSRITADPSILPNSVPISDEAKSNGTRSSLKKYWFPRLDLAEFGILLDTVYNKQFRSLTGEEAAYIKIVAEQLRKWDTLEARNARWLKDQIAKLDPSYSSYMGVEELRPPSSTVKYLQIPNRQVIISDLVERITNTHSFRRLKSINQLALVELIYPGAGYRRLQHCLRSYGYCADFLVSLNNTPEFRLLFTPNVARQALVLALLHDINHFPFLHTFQELNSPSFKALDLLDLFCNGEATNDDPSIYSLVEDGTGLSAEIFKSILMENHHTLSAKGLDPSLQITKSLIDSGADVDKLAYLEDDSASTGVAYGHGIDAARLISSATVARIERPEGEAWHLAFAEEGVSAVESLVMARYWMFRNVYWHRTNRAIMTMLLHVVRQLFPTDKSLPEEQQSLFVEVPKLPPPSPAREFVINSMWRSEEEVLAALNGRFKEKFGRDSVIANILRKPTTVYTRLFSLQGADSSPRESEIYERLLALDSDSLDNFRRELTVALNDRFCKGHHRFGADDVLLDIPRRELDTSGDIYIRRESGSAESLYTVEGPVKNVLTKFDELAKRVRIFIKPGIIELPKSIHTSSLRTKILEDISQSLPKALPNQVR